MQCPNCNNPVKEGSGFCGYCGARLVQPPVAQPAQPVPAPVQQPVPPPVQPAPVPVQPPVAAKPVQKSGSKKVWVLSIVFSLVFVLILGVGTFTFLVINDTIDLSDTFLAFLVEDSDPADARPTVEVATYEDDEFAILDEDGDLVIDSNDVASATVSTLEDSDVVGITLVLNGEGTKKFAAVTKANVGKQLEIYVDHELVSVADVSLEITNGRFMLTCDDLDQAEEYCQIINDCIS